MSRRTSIVSLEQIREINLTPLIDLTFLLLITFIITFPLLEQGIPVNLPRGRAEELVEQDVRTIALDAEGRIYLDQRPVAPDELEREMTALGAADPDIVIRVRADESIRYGKVAEILGILHRAKIARMALITQGEGGEGRSRWASTPTAAVSGGAPARTRCSCWPSAWGR